MSLLAIAGDSVAAPATHVVDTDAGDATTDWTLGLVVASGESAADLRAPSPQIARVKAERRARSRARDRLLEKIRSLPLAEGDIGRRLDADRALATRIQQLVEDASVHELDYASDGSVVLQLSVPLHALERALAGAGGRDVGRSPAADPAKAPATVIVRAGKHVTRPRLGLRLAITGRHYSGPIAYHRSMKDALADKRVSARVLAVHADVLLAATEGDERAFGPAMQLSVARGVEAYKRSRGKHKRARGKSEFIQVVDALERGALTIVVLESK